MRTTKPNPFLRPPYSRFQLEPFARLVETEPLEARAVLDAAVADGSIVFPLGTSDRTHYRWIVGVILDRKEGDTGEDTPVLRERYSPLLTLPSEDLGGEGFPYSFVRELLGRLAQGEHPLFLHAACGLIRSLLEGDPEAPDEAQNIRYEQATAAGPH